MSKNYLYLDDMRVPKNDTWIVAANYDEFVVAVNEHGLETFNTISLDHDLGIGAMREWYRATDGGDGGDGIINYDNINEKTGYDAAKFLVELSLDTGIPLPTIFVHSANSVGSENIIKYIENYFKSCGLDKKCTWVEQPFTVPNGGF